MPVFQESTYDDRELTRYLLGQLAGDDADRLDELAIVDDDMAWRVRVVENDLVDAYVRGTLDTETRQSFESHYLASPKRRAKVQFATRFTRAVDAFGPPTERPERRGALAAGAGPSAEHAREAREGGWGWLDWLVPRSAGRWAFASGAAVLMLVVISGLLLIRDLRLGRALQESEQQRASLDRRAKELEDRLAGQRAASAAATADASDAAATDAQRARQAPTSSPDSARSPVAPVAAVALALWPQTRGADASGPAGGTATRAAAVVTLPQGVDRVTLELQLESPDFVRYAAALKESDTGRIVWRAERLTASTSDASPMVPVAVPAHVLKTRAYVLELTGHGAADAAGDGEAIGSYAFQVTRQ